MKIDDLRDGEGRPLWEGHRSRLRRRMERDGWNALKPHEMVELVLCHALPRQDLSAVSRLLVDRFGSVGGVFRASRDEIMGVPGATPGMAEWIVLTGELVSAYRQMHNVGDIRLDCYPRVAEYLKPLLPRKQRDGLWVIYSDFNFNLITITDLREAGAWWAAENTRRMVMDAIGHGARYAYMVIWKDRPTRGMDDVETARLDAIASVLYAADLDLVDCLLVNDREVYSMRIYGQMNGFSATAAGGKLRETYGNE